jgi:hypothetical protein
MGKKKNIINNLSNTTMLKSIKTKFKQGASHAFFPNSRGQEVQKTRCRTNSLITTS